MKIINFDDAEFIFLSEFIYKLPSTLSQLSLDKDEKEYLICLSKSIIKKFKNQEKK